MRISTVIPAYNRADLIGETLRSVLSQTRPPAEVIVVDDGSTDGTQDVVSEQFGRDVTLIQQENAGAGPARNNGFTRATGEIVHFMDSDDLSSLNSYAEQAAAIEAGADMAYGPWLKTRFEGTKLLPEPLVLQQGALGDLSRIGKDTLLLNWVTVFQPCMFRSELIRAVGPYRSDLKPSEDTEMLYRISRAAKRMVHTPETVVLYRVHPENQVSEQNIERRLIDQANLWRILDGHAAKEKLDKSDAALMRMKKIHVANQVRSHDSQRADLLLKDITLADQVKFPFYRLSQRMKAKLRMLHTGNPYDPIFEAGPVTPSQISQINLLGYELTSATS